MEYEVLYDRYALTSLHVLMSYLWFCFCFFAFLLYTSSFVIV